MMKGVRIFLLCLIHDCILHYVTWKRKRIRGNGCAEAESYENVETKFLKKLGTESVLESYIYICICIHINI